MIVLFQSVTSLTLHCTVAHCHQGRQWGLIQDCRTVPRTRDKGNSSNGGICLRGEFPTLWKMPLTSCCISGTGSEGKFPSKIAKKKKNYPGILFAKLLLDKIEIVTLPPVLSISSNQRKLCFLMKKYKLFCKCGSARWATYAYFTYYFTFYEFVPRGCPAALWI